MGYKDRTYTREVLQEPSAGNFNVLIDETCKVLHALKLFRTVGIKVRNSELIVTPACVVYPISRIETLTLNNAVVMVEYKVGLAYGFKEPNDSVITQMALDYTETISKRLGRSLLDADALDYTKNILIFSAVAGHYQTELLNSEFGEVTELGQNILAYNSGLILVYSVEETK